MSFLYHYGEQNIYNNNNKCSSKVIWQEAASPSCHPLRRRMNPHQIHNSLDPHESVPIKFPNASQSVQPFLHSSQMCPTHIHITQTHVWYLQQQAASLHCVHAMRP